jgi:predicted phage-related endonuclease
MRLLMEKEIEIDRKFQEFNQTEKETQNRLRMELKEKERVVC